MTSNRARRIAKEIADTHNDTLLNISASPLGNGEDLTHLKGSFKGPPGTPYEGGTYTIDIRIPGEYPFRPPIMQFDTKIWHPNVSSQTVSSTILVSGRGNPTNKNLSRGSYASTHSPPVGLLFLLSNLPCYHSSLCLARRSQRIHKMQRLPACCCEIRRSLNVSLKSGL